MLKAVVVGSRQIEAAACLYEALTIDSWGYGGTNESIQADRTQTCLGYNYANDGHDE